MTVVSPKSILKNAFALSVADAASKGATGLLALVLARWLGPAVFGAYATASAVAGLFMLVTGLGFEQEFMRRAGRNRDSLGHAFKLTLNSVAITGAVALLGMAAFALSTVYPRNISILVVLMGLAAVVARFHFPFRFLCLVLAESEITAFIQSIATIALLAGTAALLYMNAGLASIASAQVAVNVITLGAWALWLKNRRGISWSTSVNKGETTAFVRDALPFAMSSLLWVAYFNLDAFLLSLFQPASEVGIYAGVYRIVGIAYVLGYAVANTFTPRLFEKHLVDPAGFARISRTLVGAMSAIGVVSAAALYLLSGPLVRFLIGDAYEAGVIIARVLSISVFFRMLNFALSEILTASGRQKSRVALEVAMLALNAGVNLALIPGMSGRGAAWATVAAEGFLFAGALIAVRGRLAGRAAS